MMTDANPGRSGLAGRRVWPVRRRAPGPAGTAEDIAVQDIAERDAVDQRLPPPDPEPMADPPSRLNLAALRLAALGLILVLVLALALVRLFVGGPPSVAQLRAQSGVDGWPVLKVGVKDDQPGTAERDADGHWSGFDIDIAYMIAEDLGFRQSDVQFYAIESEDRARMQATDPNGKGVPVKLVVASYSITAERKTTPGVLFSQAYLYTEQSVLTLTKAHHERVSTMSDLAREKVCTISASTSIKAPQVAQAIPVPRNRISQCIDDLRQGRVKAVTTDAAILAGWKARFPDEFDHWDVGLDPTEAWGINVGDNPALQKLVDLTLYRSYADPKDDRWELAYAAAFQTEVSENAATPIAVAEQPRVEKPDIRDLPWESVVP